MHLIIGDSHILALENYCVGHEFHQYSGSSIRGLLNKNSKSGVGNQIINLVNTMPYEKLFIMFGKVDMDWVYPYKLKKHDIHIDDFIEETLDKYMEFINLISHNFKTIYVMGLHLPTLEEDEMMHCININHAIIDVTSKANLEQNMNPVKPIGSQQYRTKQIINFNNRLQNRIGNNQTHIQYLDITNDILDKKTNIVKKYFIAKGDHHLIRIRAGMVWSKYITPLF